MNPQDPGSSSRAGNERPPGMSEAPAALQGSPAQLSCGCPAAKPKPKPDLGPQGRGCEAALKKFLQELKPIIMQPPVAPAQKSLVVKAVQAEGGDPGPGGTSMTGPGQVVTLDVPGLHQWMMEKENEGKRLALFLDGAPFKDLPTQVDRLPADRIGFRLEIPDGALGNWAALLSNPVHTRVLRVNLGTGDTVIAASDQSITFRPLGVMPFTLALLDFVVLAALFIVLGRKTSVLRGPAREGERYFTECPYSLGLTQMAFWFLLVLFAVITIFMVTGHLPGLNASILSLMGISAATGISANFGDSVSATQIRKALLTRQAALEGGDVKAKDPGMNVPDSILNAWPPKHQSFLMDLITDLDGSIQLPRLQMLIWTVVLGSVFIVTALKTMTIPSFPNEVLTLLGISSGVYVGFKFPENNGR